MPKRESAEVWSDAIPPGGYVCAVPQPGNPDGICGYPVESEPCPIHGDELDEYLCGHCGDPKCDGTCEGALAELAESQPDW
jgi:hypothetical protein